MSLSLDQPLPDPIEDAYLARVTIYMGFVSFTILMWDHFITLSDEVNYIWKGRKGPIVWLFFLNRYLTPFSFMVNLFAYLSPTWTPERCEHFVRYEGSMTIIGLNTTALMMLLRVYAMYPGKWGIISTVAAAFCVELGINAWLMTHGAAVRHNSISRVTACTMIFDPAIGHIASASAWTPLLYDTLVVLLTLFRTVGPVRHQTAGKIMRVLLRDGLLYYSVIFSINLVLTLMISFAPPTIKNITAQMEYLLTVAMMSRITLHLKKQGRLNDSFHHDTWATFSRVTSAPAPSILRFASNPAVRRDHMPPQVSITVQELVTRDDVESFHHERSPPIVTATRIPLPSSEIKSGEWYEMDVARKV